MVNLSIRSLCSFLIVASLPLLATAQINIAGSGNSSSFPGVGVGPIPDRGATGCGAPSGPPLNITFSVSGLGYPATDLASIEVDMDVTHTWTGDVNAELVAPDGVTSHTLFGRTGSTTETGCGDSSDVGGVYTFGSSGDGDFWAAAAAAAGAGIIPGGSYRTSEPGGSASGGTFTDMLASFAGLADLNGNWTLSVTDFGGGDTGEVNAASLVFTQASSFPGASTGPIPDRGTAGCGPPSGPPLNVTFAVSGLDYAGSGLASIEVDVDMTHTWTGDVNAELVAPDGVTSHVLVGRTGATTATGCGDSSDLNTVYTFSSSGSGDFWAAAAAAAATIPGGIYRTSSPGGSASGGTFTDMLASFAGLADLNGNWTLSVTDFGGGDTGAVGSATLRFIQLIDPVFGDSFEEPPPP